MKRNQIDEATHTPGPWHVTHRKAIERTVQVREHFAVAPLDGPTFAFLPAGRIDIQEANARLIATAPELLAALREAVELHGHEYAYADGRPIEIPGSTVGIDWYKQARAAIAKAEGK